MTTKPEREMTRAEWQALQPDDDGDGPTWGEFTAALSSETREALTDDRPRDAWGFLAPAATTDGAGNVANSANTDPSTATAATTTTAPEYVTLQQVATYLKRNKEQVRRDLNNDPDAPQPIIKGRKGQRHEWLWSELRPWLEAKYGRKPPERFWH